MDCRQVHDRIVPWLEDELAPSEAELIREHIERCEPCADLAGRLDAQGEILATLPPPVDPRLASPAYWSRMDDALAAEWDKVQAERKIELARQRSLPGRVMSGLLALGRPSTWRSELKVSPVGIGAYVAVLLMALFWGWSNLERAETAQAEATQLAQELDRERQLAIQPRVPARVEPVRPVNYTPRRGTF